VSELVEHEEILIPGPAGQIEALLSHPVAGEPAAIAVICHPHPLYGGSLTNKVVHILGSAFLKMALPVLRFNFRGVGASEGEFDGGEGEQADLEAAVAWLRQRYPGRPLWLAGFSFGAFVAYNAHRQLDAARLLLVAPPLRLFEFGDLRSVEIPWMVVQGSNDEVVSADAVQHWVQNQPRPPVFEMVEGASHFFHGRLNDLRQIVLKNWA